MQKCIFLVANIYKCSVEVWNKLPHPTQINISYRILLVYLLAVEFYQSFILEQSNVYTMRSGIYYEFNVHCCALWIIKTESKRVQFTLFNLNLVECFKPVDGIYLLRKQARV
jgi:hypothetical protein